MNSPSNQTKSRGGRRAGAGRKPSTVRGVVKKLDKYSAELILQEIKANQKLIDLSHCGEPNVELQVVKFLWEQAYGKAQQSIEHTGNIKHEHIDLSHLSNEELEHVRRLIDSAPSSASHMGREL